MAKLKVTEYSKTARVEAEKSVHSSLIHEAEEFEKKLEKLIDKFEQLSKELCQELADVIALHYALVNTGDPDVVKMLTKKEVKEGVISAVRVYSGICLPSKVKTMTRVRSLLSSLKAEIERAITKAVHQVNASL